MARAAAVEAYQTPVSRQRIMMRIGCHAGIVIGAVVGRTLPRYQLFGKDMDVVQRMEQESTPNAIHVSGEFAQALSVATGGQARMGARQADGTYFLDKTED